MSVRVIVGAVVLGLALLGARVAACADDQVGPAIGESAGTFDVVDVTGPNKGKTLCYV